MNSDEDAMAQRSASIKALKSFTREAYTVGDFEEFEKEITGKNDRTIAILWATLIESSLDEAIPSRLRKDLPNEVKRRMFDNEGCIGTFSAKIVMGYALQLYGRVTFHDLDIIRELRNSFAHSSKALRFDAPVVKNVCETLLLPDSKIAIVPSSLEHKAYSKNKNIDTSDSRTRFSCACHTIIMRMIDLGGNSNGTDLP